MTAVATERDNHQTRSPHATISVRARWTWPAVAVLTTLVVAALRLVVTPSFYFADDTQTGTSGQWWHLGEMLVNGQWPLLDPNAWTAGNYMAEGQWGLFNPLIWIFSVGTYLSVNVLIAVTTAKIIMLGVMALGVHLLARSFGASSAWSAAAGVLAPLGGFTVYMDAPSWTTGLLASAVLPWAWWGLRRLAEDRRNPLAFLVASGLLITFGYVFGVIVLVLIFAEAIVRAAISRDGPRVARVAVAGLYAALLTIAIYLPGILTAPVTIRGTNEILNTGFLNADLTDMAGASTATMTASIGAWWGGATSAPLIYILWALPALALFRCPRERLRILVPLLGVGALLLMIVTGPDQIGPIRWPVRFMPYLVIVVVVGFAAIASGSRPARSARGALVTALSITAAATWVSTINTTWEWRQAALSLVVQTGGVVALWWLLYRPRRVARPAARTPSLMAIVTAGIGVLLVAPQMYLFPTTPLPQLGIVSDPSAASDVPGDVTDDAIVVGNIYAGWTNPATFDERLIGNQWYFSAARVSSLYTVLPYRTYVEDLCADLRGSTCADALSTLVSTDAHTRSEVATLLGVNTIIAIKSSFPTGLPALPADWRVEETGKHTWVIQREDPVAPAGGVAWTSPGTAVSVEHQDDSSVVMKVQALAEEPTVVLSRLAWPGYSITGAMQAASVREYLLTLDLRDARVGDTVTIEFRPPGWTIEVGGIVTGLVILVGWPLVAMLRRGRRGF